MKDYILKRIAGTCLNLVLASFFVFTMLNVVPGDVASSVLGENVTVEQLAAFREKNNLDRPVYERYSIWASDAITGNLGKSFRSGFDITDEFKRRFPITLELVLLSFTFTTVLGVTFGIFAAIHQDSIFDYMPRLFAVAGLSIPSFLVLSLLLIIPAYLFSYAPPFFATSFFAHPVENLQLFVPATFVLAISASASLMRLTRTAFLDVLRQDYMRTARSKGLSSNEVILRHGLKNILGPITTAMGLQLGAQLNGAIILETVLGLPGLGTWALGAIEQRDYPVVMAFSLYSALMIMLISLIVDLSYALFDPRIRYT